MSDLVAKVERVIRERALLRRGDRILVAVSGGQDSMALLHLLRQLAQAHEWRLFVAHFNHQLRGRESAGDAQLVRKVSRQLALPCYCGRGAVRKLAAKCGLSLEMAARELRHRFLAATARKCRCNLIAMAHHADDQVELFFLRLLRGAGGEGLAGMKWKSVSPVDAQVQLVRPLLGLERTELAAFVAANQLAFRHDASNDATEILRNRVRHELWPFIRTRFPNSGAATLLRVMDLLREDGEALDDFARKWLRLSRPAFNRLPVALQRRVVQLQLRRLKLVEQFDLIEALRLERNRRRSISADMALSLDARGRLKAWRTRHEPFGRKRCVIELKGRKGEGEFGGVKFQWRRVPWRNGRWEPQTGEDRFDAQRIGARLELRYWRPGDRFQPIGMSESVKLQDWFINQKVPRDLRRKLVLACSEPGDIFWVEGQRIGEACKLRPETRQHLIWRWQRG